MGEMSSTRPSRSWRRHRHSIAAVAYAVYGVVYLVGAILELAPERKVTFFGFVPWWAFYVLGGALILTLPFVLRRGVRWLAGLLAFFVAAKALHLLWKIGRAVAAGEPASPYLLFFAAVAALTAVALAVSAWSPRDGASPERVAPPGDLR